MASLTACSWMPVLLTACLIQTPPTDAVSEQCTELYLSPTVTELYSKGISCYSAEISCQSHPSDTVWLRDGEVQGASRISCSVNGDRIRLEDETRPENCSIRINDNFQQKPNAKCILNETSVSPTTSRTLTNSAVTHDDSSADVRQPADRQTDSKNSSPGVVQYVLLLLCFPTCVFALYCKDNKVVISVEDHTDETSVV